MIITPLSFYQRYIEELREKAMIDPHVRADCRNDLSWTPVTLEIARKVMASFDLKCSTEYFRIDLLGCTSDNTGVNWDLRVAYEHENRDSWRDELCKLTHIVANLRVLVSYHAPSEGRSYLASLQQALGDAVAAMGPRMTRVPGSQWLFIFGPRCKNIHDLFVGFTIDATGSLQRLPDANGIPFSLA